MKNKTDSSNSTLKNSFNPFLGKKQWLLLPIFMVLLTLIRLPYLNSDNYILDGDEAVVGLMVKHFSEGKEVPFFFYGQEYGFCFLEVLAATPFYWVLGPTDFALNLGMLLLFSLGIFYLYRISFHFSKSFIFSSLLSLFMGVFPVWVVWATKARGGYESAFFLAMLSLWLLLVKWKDEKPSIKQGLILGALLGFIWLAQPLWLPGLLPFVVYFFIKDKAWMNFGVSAFVAGVLAWGVKFFLATSDWYKPSKSFGGFEFGNIANLFSWLYDSFTGWFYLDQLLHNPSYQAFTKVEMPPMVNLLAGIGVLLFIALAVMGLIKYKKDNWQFVTGLSLIFSLGIIGIMLKENPRYLLPAAFYLFVAMAIIGSVYVKQKPALANGILTVFILLGIGGVFGFKEYGFQPFHGKVDQREEIQKLARFLKTKNENYAISSGHLLHWQLMFYSQEEVIMRHNSPIDRYPAYPEQIDAHLEKGGVIPMVGFLGLYRGLNQHPKMQEAQQVGKIYFYIPGFDKAFLEQLRYKF